MQPNYRLLQARKLAKKERDEQNQMRAGRWGEDHAVQAAEVAEAVNREVVAIATTPAATTAAVADNTRVAAATVPQTVTTATIATKAGKRSFFILC